MVTGEKIYPGARVRLVDSWVGTSGLQNQSGKMDRYLGMIVTVDKVFSAVSGRTRFHICEDTRSIDCGISPEFAPRYNKWQFDNTMVAEVLPPFDEEDNDLSPVQAGELIGSLL